MSFIGLSCVILTIVIYLLSKKIHQHYPYLLCSPGIFTPIVLISVMLIFNISYDSYMQDGQWLIWMLGPATVAFAIPIYEYRILIQQHAISIGMGVIFGMSAGMISAFALAQLFHFDHATTFSLMARSISTPFAMELSREIGGSVELVILFTMITGILGMLFGDLILGILRLKSHFAMGASLGNAAHGFGTSKAYSRDREEGVIASLTMVLSGIFMVLCGPMLVKTILLFV